MILGLTLYLTLISCEKSESVTGFFIKFSNDIVINQDDIVFYDSSECIFLLKDTISFSYSTGNPPDVEFVDFSISIDNNVIYSGIVYPEGVSMVSPNPTYIASYTYDDFNSNILHVKFVNYFRESLYDDTRNDNRIISFFENNNNLRKGIAISLDSISIASDNDSTITTTISIENRDNLNYYLPDPIKVGSEHFNYLVGGLILIDTETSIGYSPYVDYSSYDYNWNKLKMEDLSILEANSKITYTYNSLYSQAFEMGLYDCNFRFGVLRDFNTITIPLEQDNGWVWIGDKTIRINNLLIE